MTEDHRPKTEEARYHYFEKQEVSVDDFEESGRILDIGGGGERVFSEDHRSLAPREKFLIWDVLFPPRADEVKDKAILLLKVNLSDEKIETGYGVRGPEKGRELAQYLDPTGNSFFGGVRHNDDI